MTYTPALVIHQKFLRMVGDAGVWEDVDITAELVAKVRSGWVSMKGEYHFNLSGVMVDPKDKYSRFVLQKTVYFIRRGARNVDQTVPGDGGVSAAGPVHVCQPYDGGICSCQR